MALFAVAALDPAFGDRHPDEIDRARWKPAELLGLPQVVADRPVLDDLAVFLPANLSSVVHPALWYKAMSLTAG